MKWLIAAWLVLMVPVVHAVECGPLIMYNKVKALERSLKDAISALNQHQNVLFIESKRLASSTSEASYNEFLKTDLEMNRITLSTSAGELDESRLDAILILASIRDLMVDKQAKLIVEQYLSEYAVHIKNSAEINHRAISNALTQVSRPGVAIDVSKLRDAIGMVVREFQRCESPKPLSRRPPTRQ